MGGVLVVLFLPPSLNEVKGEGSGVVACAYVYR